MSRPRIEPILAVLLSCSLLACFDRAATAQDRAASWLEARGMYELLQIHLEQARAEAVDDPALRARTASRLAGVYASLIERSTDDEARAVLVAKARRLLADDSIEDAEALRLALLRTRYQAASGTIERGRVDLAEPAETVAAERELDELARDLVGLRESLEDTIKRRDRGLDRARGMRVVRLDEEITAARRMLVAASLLEGWSLYYAGRAFDDRSRLDRAQLAFGRVLDGDEVVPGPDDVSVDRQEFEYFASAILGMAMSSAELVSHLGAGPWFARLELPRTHPGILQATPGWRLASAIDAGAFETAETLLRSMIEAADGGSNPEALPTAWLRLAAVGGLRGAEETTSGLAPQASRLAELALATLAARSELAQVVDLVERYGLEAVGRDGFAFRYVRGVGHYRTAVDAKAAGRAGEAAAEFALAVAELAAAGGEDDAVRFPEARAACLTLTGWSLLELDRAADAADAFEAAADGIGGVRRADAMWGAIVSLDRLVAAGGAEAADAQTRRDAIIERFLDTYPADDRAPSLVVRRITGEEDPSAGDIDTLLAIPPDHPTWEIARRRAAQAIYRRFREVEADERGEFGRRFLDIADEILQRDRSGDGMFVDLRGADGVLLRQAAEVASHEEVGDRDRGAGYISRIELALERGGFENHPDLPNELAYRRIGLAISDGDFLGAAMILEDVPVVPDAPEAIRWSRLSAQRLHRAAFREMRDGEAAMQVVRAAVLAGDRFIEIVGGEGTPIDEALEISTLLPVAASVAAGRQAIYRVDDDETVGREAFDLYRAILEKRPRDGSILEATAELATSLGDAEFALACWRRLGSAAPKGSEIWWRARCGLIGMLAETDPSRAAQVLEQVRVLHPDFGPEPWRSRLQALDVDISIRLDAGVPDADSTDGETTP